jgi:hypothetical protein
MAVADRRALLAIEFVSRRRDGCKLLAFAKRTLEGHFHCGEIQNLRRGGESGAGSGSTIGAVPAPGMTIGSSVLKRPAALAEKQKL